MPLQLLGRSGPCVFVGSCPFSSSGPISVWLHNMTPIEVNQSAAPFNSVWCCSITWNVVGRYWKNYIILIFDSNALMRTSDITYSNSNIDIHIYNIDTHIDVPSHQSHPSQPLQSNRLKWAPPDGQKQCRGLQLCQLRGWWARWFSYECFHENYEMRLFYYRMDHMYCIYLYVIFSIYKHIHINTVFISTCINRIFESIQNTRWLYMRF